MKQGILRFWDRRWRLLLVLAALLAVFIWGMAAGPYLLFPPPPEPSSVTSQGTLISPSLNDNKTRIEIVQGLVTTLGILVAGIWTYYVFVRGRTFIPNIRIEIDLKQELDLPTAGKGAIVTVTVKNLGRIEVRKLSCIITAMEVTDISQAFPRFSRMDAPAVTRRGKTYPIFDEIELLEPGQEAIEDVLFSIDKPSTFKVLIAFRSPTRTWHLARILDTRTLKQE